MKKLYGKIQNLIWKLDKTPLWVGGFVLIAIVFSPIFVLGEGSCFPIHDQLDETFLSYVLNARHLLDNSDTFPEMMCGLNKSGLQPSAPLFVFLYCVLPVFPAFVLQYMILFGVAFFGMYVCVREFTDSSILAAAIAGCFSMLPYQPVYGTSIVGVPMLMTVFLYLLRGKSKRIVCYLLILFFTFTSHLVLIGYVVLGYWLLYLIYAACTGKWNRYAFRGFAVLFCGYLVTNLRLILDLFADRSFVSHREEFVNAYTDFAQTTYEIFTEGAGLHAVSLHHGLILPIVAGIAIGGILFRFLSEKSKQLYRYALIGMFFLIASAFAYGFFHSEVCAAWQNGQTGVLRYFSFDRIIWIYPSGWLMETGLILGVWWHAFDDSGRTKHRLLQKVLVHLAIPAAVLLPAAHTILYQSYFYMNVNQYNNGSGITGYITWEDWFAENLMKQLENVMGDPSGYRIAHIGINPTPSIVHGFYTVDGYSNNYALEYKQEFRTIIASELEKSEACRVYYDTWGSRCYLFNHISGDYMYMQKGNSVVYEGLEYDMDALKKLGCKYILSGARIGDADAMGMKYIGYFDAEPSYWGVWLYEIL